MRKILIAAAFVVAPLGAQADSFPPVADPTVKKECGACHMAFQPQMLPAQSWEKIMGGLSQHFGEDASLDGPTAERIRAYLVANSAETSRSGRKMMRGTDPRNPPLRISELGRFYHKHGEYEARGMQAARGVKSWANCNACHRGAEQGYYED